MLSKHNEECKEVCKENPPKPNDPELTSPGSCWCGGTVNNARKCNLIIFASRERNGRLQLPRAAGAEGCVQPRAGAGAAPGRRDKDVCRVELKFEVEFAAARPWRCCWGCSAWFAPAWANPGFVGNCSARVFYLIRTRKANAWLELGRTRPPPPH